MDFLQNPGDPLTMDDKLKLSGEITRLEGQIQKIQEMPFGKVKEDSGDYKIPVPSKLETVSCLKEPFISPGDRYRFSRPSKIKKDVRDKN